MLPIASLYIGKIVRWDELSKRIDKQGLNMKLRYMCTIIEGVIVVSGSVSLVMHGVRQTKAQSSGPNSSERMKHWTKANTKVHLFILYKWF